MTVNVFVFHFFHVAKKAKFGQRIDAKRALLKKPGVEPLYKFKYP